MWTAEDYRYSQKQATEKYLYWWRIYSSHIKKCESCEESMAKQWGHCDTAQDQWDKAMRHKDRADAFGSHAFRQEQEKRCTD